MRSRFVCPAKAVDEGVVHTVDHKKALGRSADLTREMERGRHRAGGSNLERCVRRHDHGVRATGLDDRRLHPRRPRPWQRALPAATEPVKATACVLSDATSASRLGAPPGRQRDETCRQRRGRPS